jgi:Ankyrin repeats (3 copies)
MAPHAEVEGEPRDDDERDQTESEDGEEEEEEEFDLKKRFHRILKDLKSGLCDLSLASDQAAFVDANIDILRGRTVDEQQNFLHFLASGESDPLPPPDTLDPLVRILTQLPENLLGEVDGDNKTPLYIAASRAKRKHKLLRAMCEAHVDIDSVLEIQCFNKETCIHVAIRKKVPQAHILYLISLAGPRTLSVQDHRGNTPLHVAVDYDLCVEDHLKIVTALVTKSDAAMDIVNAKGMSPYRYHEETRTEALNNAKRAQDPAQRRLGKDSDKGLSQGRPEVTAGDGYAGSDRRDPRQTSKLLNTAQVQPIPPLPLPLQRVNTMSTAPPGKYGAGAARTVLAQAELPKSKPTIDINVDQGGTSESRTPLKTPIKKLGTDAAKTRPSKKAQKLKTADDSKPSLETANSIKSFLKLHYLRTRKHDAAVDFLYGSSQDHQIYFDLYGCGDTISLSWTKSGNNYLKFEDILQYVAVPKVRVEGLPQASQRRALKRPSKSEGKGRTDLVFLFNWLKVDRNVKTILKVIVDDLQEPAHSDEAIEAALEGLAVEIWDWRKTDLSSEVICNTAPMSRIVHLYWSGNNAVLRSWSEPEGLAKLEKLEMVHLNVKQVRVAISSH